MYNSVKLSALLLCVGILCSCGSGIKVTYEEKEYSTGEKTATITLPLFETETEFGARVNAETENQASLLLDNFLKSEKVTDLSIKTEITNNDGRLISFVMEGEATGEEPHGEKLRLVKTIDFAEEKTVKLDELFMDDSWKTLFDNKMRLLAEDGQGDYAELWDIPSTKHLDMKNFYIKDGSLVIFFPPYELSYYRRGYVEFEFTPQEIGRVLSDYGKQILYII